MIKKWGRMKRKKDEVVKERKTTLEWNYLRH